MPRPELVLLEVGCGLLLLAFLWRATVRRRVRRLIRRALVHPEPAVRRAAVRVVGDHGLTRHAKALLSCAQHEQDPSVLTALAEEVVRNHWEPDDDRRLVKLRLWARLRLDLGPEVEDDAFAPSLPAAMAGRSDPGSREANGKEGSDPGTVVRGQAVNGQAVKAQPGKGRAGKGRSAKRRSTERRSTGTRSARK